MIIYNDQLNEIFEQEIKLFPVIAGGENADEMVAGREYGLVAINDTTKHVVGYLIIWPKTSNIPCEIRYVEVLNEYQRKGIGTALMIRALDYLRKNGERWVNVMMTDNKKAFFEKFGFKGDVEGWGLMHLDLFVE